MSAQERSLNLLIIVVDLSVPPSSICDIYITWRATNVWKSVCSCIQCQCVFDVAHRMDERAGATDDDDDTHTLCLLSVVLLLLFSHQLIAKNAVRTHRTGSNNSVFVCSFYPSTSSTSGVRPDSSSSINSRIIHQDKNKWKQQPVPWYMVYIVWYTCIHCKTDTSYIYNTCTHLK